MKIIRLDPLVAKNSAQECQEIVTGPIPWYLESSLNNSSIYISTIEKNINIKYQAIMAREKLEQKN